MNFVNKRTDTRFLVVVATFGHKSWSELAEERAIPSAVEAAGEGNVLVSHGLSLADARNIPSMLYCDIFDWYIFLDADDELDKDYVRQMRSTVEKLPEGDFIIQPSTINVVDGVPQGKPRLIEAKDTIYEGNHCVIGSAVPSKLFNTVGGFDNWDAWEDWALWIKCHQAGAEFTTCPGAIYRIGVDSARTSRNQIQPKEARALFKRIRKHYGVDK